MRDNIAFDSMQFPLLYEGQKVATRRPVRPGHKMMVEGRSWEDPLLTSMPIVGVGVRWHDSAGKPYIRQMLLIGQERGVRVALIRQPTPDRIQILDIKIARAGEMNDGLARELGATFRPRTGFWAYPTHRTEYTGTTPTEAYMAAWERWWRTGPDALVWIIQFEFFRRG